jgi:hypothetical protein
MLAVFYVFIYMFALSVSDPELKSSGEYAVEISPILRRIGIRKSEILREYTIKKPLSYRSISVRKSKILREYTIKNP